LNDVRYAARSLARTPAVVFVTVTCLALAIGVNTTLFSLFNAVLLQEPSAREPDRLVRIEPGNGNQISYLNYRDLRGNAAFADAAISGATPLNLRSGDEIRALAGMQVSGNFFQLLGVNAFVGRTFTASESDPEQRARVVVLDHALWSGRFRADRNLVGSTIDLNGEPFTVIGILAPDHRPGMGLYVPDAYVPVSAVVSAGLDDRGHQAYELRARLAPGVTRQQAQAAFTVAAGELERAYPKQNVSFGDPASVLPVSGLALLQRKGTPAEMPLLVTAPFIIFGLLLLIACANVAGVLLARGASRRREIALRLALGASATRIVRLLLAESLLLCVLGAGAGLLLTTWLTHALGTVTWANTTALRLSVVRADWNVVLYVAMVAVVTTVICGFAPALQAARLQLIPGLQADTAGGGSRRSMRRVMVAGQVAGSVLLLTMCLLFVKSLASIATIDPGFDVRHGITARIDLDRNRYSDVQHEAFRDLIMERLEGLPSVEAATYASLVPLSGDSLATRPEVKDDSERRSPRTFLMNVGPRYFETMAIPLRRGREFLVTDRRGAAPVAIVNETFARLVFGPTDPLGRWVRPYQQDPWHEIVAVVADTKYGLLSESPQPLMFLPYLQRGGQLFVHLRTSGDPQSIVPVVERAIADADKSALVRVQTTSDAISFEFTVRRITTAVLTGLGALALLLAMIGLFGALSWDVARRTAEIGVRMALGATRGAVARLIVKDALTVVGAGLIAGSLLAVLVAVGLRFLLAGVAPGDPSTVAVVSGVVLAATLLASWIPVRRATSTQPNVALRRE
jgi:predicted permease